MSFANLLLQVIIAMICIRIFCTCTMPLLLYTYIYTYLYIYLFMMKECYFYYRNDVSECVCHVLLWPTYHYRRSGKWVKEEEETQSPHDKQVNVVTHIPRLLWFYYIAHFLPSVRMALERESERASEHYAPVPPIISLSPTTSAAGRCILHRLTFFFISIFFVCRGVFGCVCVPST